MLCLLTSTRSAQLTQEDVQNSLLHWKPVTEAVGGVWGEQESAMTFLSFVLQSLVELDESAKALLCTRCDLEHEAVCDAAGCPAHGRPCRNIEPQHTFMVLVQNPDPHVCSLLMLLTEQWQAKLLDDGLRCEECRAIKNVKEQATVRDLATILVLGFPRGAEVRSGRQMRNRHSIDCPLELTFEEQDKQYSLAAIVEQHHGNGCGQRAFRGLGASQQEKR